MLRSTSKRRLTTIVRAAVTLGAAWLVFHKIDWTTFANHFVHADLVFLGWSIMPLIGQFAASVRRWQIVIHMLSGAAVSLALLAISLGRSLLIGQYLPSTVGSDIVRAAMVVNRTGVAIAVRSVICDRLIGLIMLVAMILLTLPLFAAVVNRGAAFLALAVVAFSSSAAFILFVTSRGLLARLPLIGNHAARIAADLRIILRPERATGSVLLLSLAAQVCNVLLIFGLARALGTAISPLQCLLIVPPALLIASFPVSLGGWGVREGALAAGFALVGASSAAGVAASILYGLTSPLIGIVAELAMPFVWTRKIATNDTL